MLGDNSIEIQARIVDELLNRSRLSVSAMSLRAGLAHPSLLRCWNQERGLSLVSWQQLAATFPEYRTLIVDALFCRADADLSTPTRRIAAEENRS